MNDVRTLEPLLMPRRKCRPDPLDRKNKVALAQLSGHGQSDLPHALRTLARRWSFGLSRVLPRSCTVFLVELLLSPLPLLLQPLDDVDRATDMVLLRDGAGTAATGLDRAEHSRRPRQ